MQHRHVLTPAPRFPLETFRLHFCWEMVVIISFDHITIYSNHQGGGNRVPLLHSTVSDPCAVRKGE